jgi:hypothetical protein
MCVVSPSSARSLDLYDVVKPEPKEESKDEDVYKPEEPLPPPIIHAYGEQWLTRFNTGNAHAWGLLNHGVLVGSSKLDGDQMTQGDTGFT